MAFRVKLPVINKQPVSNVPAAECGESIGLPQFTKKQFTTVELIGAGSYGKVFKVRQDAGPYYVVKELESRGNSELKLFKKEAMVLKTLCGYENIVQIHGYSFVDRAIMLEYSCFRFQRIGVNHEPAHNLKELLLSVDELNECTSFQHLQYHLTKDILAGLAVLHSKGIAHRDLKPDNVLISNMHYDECPEEEVQHWWMIKPVIAKLTDFGESRSALLQTRTLIQTSTTNVNRGSPVYMAPEALLGSGEPATLKDLQKMDIWSLGMTIFHILNPNARHPYSMEIDEQQPPSQIDALKQYIGNKQLPLHSEKYSILHEGCWKPVKNVYSKSMKFRANQRPTAEELLDKFIIENVNLEPLLVSQASVTEAIDVEYAKGLKVNEANTSETLNACSFLSLLIAEKIISSTGEEVNVANVTQDIILNFPKRSNEKREHDRHYSIDEAYKLLLSSVSIKPHEFTVEIMCQQEKEIHLAKEDLCHKLSALLEVHADAPFSAMYTCPPYVFTICKPYRGQLTIVDTHPITERHGGSATGGVITAKHPETTVASLCAWLFHRMGCGEKMSQELTVMKPWNTFPMHSGEDEYTGHSHTDKDRSNGYSHEAGDSCHSSIDNDKNPECSHDNLDAFEDGHIHADEDVTTRFSHDIAHSNANGGMNSSPSCEDGCSSENEDENNLYSSEAGIPEVLGDVDFISNTDSAPDTRSLDLSMEMSSGSEQGENTENIYVCRESHWHNNKETPVYMLNNKTPYSMKGIFSVLFKKQQHSQKLCTKRPLCVRQDAIFLIDLDHVKAQDIRADGNGTYKKELRHYHYVVKYSDGEAKQIKTHGRVDEYVLKEDEYFLYWNTYKKPDIGLRRQINWIVDNTGKIVNNVAFLQYTLPAHVASVHFTPDKHGHSKGTKSFPGRLAHSTLEELNNSKSTEKPSKILREFQENDPMMHDPCSLPSRKTIYNCRYAQKSVDPLQEILDYNEERTTRAIIGQHGTPGITLVFQTTYMSNNARFIKDGTVIQVDTTFGQHNFYVTVVAIQDKSLKSPAGHYPWVMLAVAFHEQRSEFVHDLIVHDIVHATPALKKVKPVIITDGETGLWKAWKKHGHVLRCCNHLQQNFKHYLLQDLHIPHAHISQFINAAFGPQGLVDSEDKHVFVEKLQGLKEDFNQWEATALQKSIGCSSKSFTWLHSRSAMFGKRVLKSARRNAGYPAGQRPNTNGVEAFNHRLKQVQEEHVRSRKLTFLEYLTQVILVIEKDMEGNLARAVIGTGDFQLAPDYQYTAVKLDMWTAATHDQKKGYLQKLRNLTLKDALKKKKITFAAEPSEDDAQCVSLDCILPHERVKTTLVKRDIPIATINLMITGAEDLLNTGNMISRKPSRKDLHQYLVHSRHSQVLHTCTINQEHVTCDCRGYKSKTVCKHSLAVAYKVNMLFNLLQWLSKQPIKTNKTSLVTKKMPGTGQKGGQQKTKPRVTNHQSQSSKVLSENDADYRAEFTKCYHNNEDFFVIKKASARKDRYKCWHCNMQFEKTIPEAPNNIVIWHRGSWEYHTQEKRVSQGYTDYYYHIKRSCIRGRYPYFLPKMLKIGENIVLNKSQRDLLVNELGYNTDLSITLSQN